MNGEKVRVGIGKCECIEGYYPNGFNCESKSQIHISFRMLNELFIM